MEEHRGGGSDQLPGADGDGPGTRLVGVAVRQGDDRAQQRDRRIEPPRGYDVIPIPTSVPGDVYVEVGATFPDAAAANTKIFPAPGSAT